MSEAIRNQIIIADAISGLLKLPEKYVQTCVTSPPYWGLRSYDGNEPLEWEAVEYTPMAGLPSVTVPAWKGNLGEEPDPLMFIGHIVAIFREVWRVLRDDGTCWVNFGDSYAGGGGVSPTSPSYANSKAATSKGLIKGGIKPQLGIKQKDLCGIPWRVAFALQADGWYLRSDIIWCLSGGTVVYAQTQKGEMPMTIKDMVRLDPSTVKLWNGEKWTQVLGWGENPHPENKIEITLRSGESIGCTGDHLWPTQRGNVRADKLVLGDVIDSCELPEPEGAKLPEYLNLSALWFVGLYLAEGSRSGSAIQIAGHAKEVDRWEKCKEIAEFYGGSVTRTISGNKMDIRVYGRVLHAIIDQYVNPGTAKTKSLKSCIWSLPNSGLKAIVMGYLHGDGHDDPYNERFRLGFTRNYNLERDLRTLAVRLGATVTIKKSHANIGDKKYPSFRGEWRWEKPTYKTSKERAEVVKIGKSRARKFWDISVQDEPHLFSLASGILTHNCKPNPMPESVTDRPTKAHEYFFLLTKSKKYFYDAEAVREKVAPSTIGRGPVSFGGKKGREYTPDKNDPNFRNGNEQWGRIYDYEKAVNGGRNKRTVWTVSTKPLKSAHFAAFPPELITPCILAGTSKEGQCSACGMPWVRVVERSPNGNGYEGKGGTEGVTLRNDAGKHTGKIGGTNSKTLHWSPQCQCNAPTVPQIVLDPFGGAATTGHVSEILGRDWVLLEISKTYAKLGKDRMEMERTKLRRKKNTNKISVGENQGSLFT